MSISGINNQKCADFSRAVALFRYLAKFFNFYQEVKLWKYDHVKAHVDLRKTLKQVGGLKYVGIHPPYKTSEDRNIWLCIDSETQQFQCWLDGIILEFFPALMIMWFCKWFHSLEQSHHNIQFLIKAKQF